ncbi:hypothetical protein PCANB_000447 [Pneumocystis canis]|nr:hypothetical protein PCANB_000447 [Pneumocystis canis]
MRSTASKINWTKLRSCYKLNTTTISSLLEFQKRNIDAQTKVNLLQEQAQGINFSYYHSIIKDKTLLNEIEKDVKGFKPLKYNIDSQMKMINLLETKAFQSAKKMEYQIDLELIQLKKTLLNIQQARPIEDLTIHDILIACPEIEEKVEKMIKNNQWSIPGYKEKFGNLTIIKGGFGVIWLAATLGSKSSLKKLQKKEILSVNVPKACEYLSEPPEPLALRLSSNLMIGVTRIFNQQYADVQLTHARIRKELSTINTDKTNINLPPTKIRSDLFTLPDDPTFIPDLNDHGWEGFMTLPETSFNIELGLQEDASSSFNLSETPISFSQHTLPRSSLSANNTISKLEFAGSISRSAINMSSLIEKDDDILGSLNGGLFDFEFDADGEIKKIDTDSGHSNHFIQRHDSIPSKFDSDEGEENVKREHAEARKRKKFNHTFEETLMAYEEVDETAFDKYVENHEIKDSSFIPQDKILETSSDIYKNDDQQQKKRKLMQLRADISIELPSEDLISWRDNYLKNMKKQSILKVRKHQEKAAINNADFFIWNFSDELIHPGLKTLFLVNQKQKDSVIHKKRAREDEINDNESFETRMNSNYAQTRKSITGTQPNSDQDIELGRHVDEELTRHTSSLMPWNQSHISSRAGSVGPGMTPVSFDTPIIGGVGRMSTIGKKKRLTASPLGDGLDDINIDIGEDAMEDFDIFGTTNADIQMISNNDYQSTIMEKESYDFLEYTQACIHQKGKGRTITFEELVPVSSSSRSVASQALCHILLLASRNILVIRQVESYQDIWIKLS